MILPDMETHLGKKLKQLLRERNLSAVQFAVMLGYDFRAVYKMFRRKHFSTALLEKISLVLNYDLLEQTSPEEKQKISLLEKEKEELKKEIVFLREVIQSLKKK